MVLLDRSETETSSRLTIVDTLDDVVRVLAVDGASNGLGGTEDLLGASGKGLGERLGLHDSAGVDKRRSRK